MQSENPNSRSVPTASPTSNLLNMSTQTVDVLGAVVKADAYRGNPSGYDWILRR